MTTPEKRKNQTDNDDVASAPAISKKRKRDLAWLKEGLAGEEPFEALKRFIAAVEAFKKKETGASDIVKDFLQNEGTGKEFLALFEVPVKRKASEIALVFLCLEAIFQRMASDLSEYREIGMAVASSILKSHMEMIYKAMSPSSNANQIKSAFRVLTAMVTLGHLTAREVIARIDFAHESIIQASQHQSFDDLPDVRSTFVMFITSFLMEEDAMLLRTIGENQAILLPVLFHLRTDTIGVVQLFLTALRDKLVMSTLLSKTLKLHIFNSRNLLQLMRLFFWMGPQKPKKPTGNDKGEDEPAPPDEELEEDKVAVAELLQSLLLSLTTSHKYGIAFPDYGLGVDSITKNNLIFQMLQDLFDFWSGPNPRIVEIQSQLVIKTIEKCPDLLDCYFGYISCHLEKPRMSVVWLNLCSLIKQIIETQNLAIIFNPKEKHSNTQQAVRAATLLGPCSLPRNFFFKGLVKENSGIRLTVGRILQTVFTKMNEFQNILSQNSKANVYSDSDKQEIFTAFKGKILSQVPPSSRLIQLCCEMRQFKGQQWYIDCWVVFLDLLVNYAKLGWIADEEQASFPLIEIVESVMECEKDESAKKELLDQLKLSVFSFILSLSKWPKMTEEQMKILVSQLATCLVDNNIAELRLCVGSLLLKIVRQVEPTQLHMSTCELNIWASALERHPKAASFFVEAFCALLATPDSYKEEADSIFVPSSETFIPPCSPLIVAAWKCFSDISDDNEATASYVSAVMCEMLLCQRDNLESFATTILRAVPKTLLSKSVEAFFQSWSGKRPIDTSALGLCSTSAMLYRACFPKDLDWSTLKSNWEEEIVHIENRMDILGVTLYQAITCISEAPSRKADRVKILGLLRVVIDDETEGSGYPLHVNLLEDPRTLDWFDLMNSRDPFVKEFNSLIRDSLHLVQNEKLEQMYQRKVNDSIANGIKKEGPLEDISDEDLFASLSKLKISEIEPQIASLVQRIKSTASEVSLRYLNVFLQLAGRLRLEGALQRISWSTFVQALRLFVSLHATTVLQKGIYNIVSVCLEFLDNTDEFAAVMKACLDSSNDYTAFCLLLVNSSSQMCTVFGQWCLEHEKHFKKVNWRIQILPAYLSSSHANDGKVLKMLHSNISPVLQNLLANRSEYLELSVKVTRLPEFLRVLISTCWTTEECHNLASKLLTEHKKGVNCAQFVEAGRRGIHHDLHAKLCLYATVRHFKSETPEPVEIEKLGHEFDWLSKQTQADLPALAKSILNDAIWKKFLKYTLRIGLRALTVDESTLPALALQVMTSVWGLLLAGLSDETTATATQVYEMITSHSEFITVIMDERGVYVEQKKALLQLLTTLVQVNPKLCQGGQVPLLLSSYYATRSISDQLIFGLLQTYEKNGVVLSPYKPYMWGQTAAAHYSIQRGTATRLSQMPEAAEVLTLLNSQKLLKTAYRFPLEMKLNGFDIVQESDDYDPRFILVSLAHILSSEYAVQCARFSQSGAISLLFAALSSPCGEMRSLAWLALGRLYSQFEKATSWPERCLWMHLVDCVRYGAAEFFKERFGGVKKLPPKISNIIALFLAKAAAIIRDPVHPMYRAINNFLLVKPSLDVNQVPEFFVMLHCTELPEQRALYRNFLLSLLRDGIRSRQDYLVCARRRVFRILLSLQPSNLLADKTDKGLILEVVQSSLQNSIIAYDLVQHRGLLMWLDSLMMSDTFSDDAGQMLAVVETMWNTLYSHMHRKRDSQEKDDEDALEKLEAEILEAEEGNHKTFDAKKQGGVHKKSINKVNCRKPIWNLLPNQQQIIAPWIMCELMQVLINLWRVLYHTEPTYADFDKYTRVLSATAKHIHESKTLIQAAQKKDFKTVRFCTPPKMLNLTLMRQIVEVSSRFVSDLPDLRDHLAAVETSKTKTKANPEELSQRWNCRHNHMRELMDQEEQNIATRCNLHMLLSLAECGV